MERIIRVLTHKGNYCVYDNGSCMKHKELTIITTLYKITKWFKTSYRIEQFVPYIDNPVGNECVTNDLLKNTAAIL